MSDVRCGSAQLPLVGMHGFGMRDFGSAGAKFDRERGRRDFSNFEQLSNAQKNIGCGGVWRRCRFLSQLPQYGGGTDGRVGGSDYGRNQYTKVGQRSHLRGHPQPKYTLSLASAVLPPSCISLTAVCLVTFLRGTFSRRRGDGKIISLEGDGGAATV